MEEKEKSTEIEIIRQQLEKKLQEIENRKKAATLKKEIKPTKKEEKTLFELRKELQELKKTINVTVVDEKKIENNSLSNSSQLKILDNTTTTTKTDSKLKSDNEFSKTISNEIQKEKEVEIKKGNTTTSKTTIKEANNNVVKEDSKSIATSHKTISKTYSKQKKEVITRNKIIFIIAFSFALLYLGYLFKLKIDLNKEKEALEKKKLERIDYNKDDAVFKEVEEDPAPEELQDIK